MVDGRYSKVNIERDPDVLSDAAQVRAMKGGSLGFTIGTNSLVAVIVGVLTWYIGHQGSTPPSCASKDDVVALDRRIESLRTDVVALIQKQSQDSEHQRNDMELVKLRLDVLKNQAQR